MKTELKYESDVTEETKTICEKYWLRANGKKNVYIYTCKEIAQEFNLSSGEVSKVAKSNVFLTVLDCHCRNCGVQKVCHTRSELIQLNLDNWMCDECSEIIRQRRHEEYLAEIQRRKQQELEARQNLIALIENLRKLQEESIPST